MVKIGIIAGSTRPGRFGKQPAQWLKQLADQREDAEYTLIDISDVNLPLLDEPVPPKARTYNNEHTKRWSEQIAELDGYVVVTAEYNHSVPGALKNAIDYLYHEWTYKPISYVSYGSLAGGSRAVEHLRGIAAEQKMYDINEQVMLPNYWNDLDDKGVFQFTENHEQQAHAMLDQLVFWAEKMQPARVELEEAMLTAAAK